MADDKKLTISEALEHHRKIMDNMDERIAKNRKKQAERDNSIFECAHMKLFVTGSHDGRWQPGASLVIARDIETAYNLLDAGLKKAGLKPRSECDYTLIEISLEDEQSLILFDGDY